MAQQFFQNANSLQAKAQHLQEILKVQPLLQQAAASFAQQQAQARNADTAPGGSGGASNAGQMNPPSSTPMMQNGVLNPQQRAQMLSQQQQQQQGLAGRQDVPGMNGQLQVGQVGHQRPQTGDQQTPMGAQMAAGQQQQSTQFPPGMASGPHQGGGAADYTSVEQPRSHAVQFTGNPFGRPGGMQSQPAGPQQFGVNRGMNNNEDQSHHAMQQYGAHGAGGLGRPALARSASNAMGAGPSTTSPSPRNPSVGNGMQGNNAKPPASANSPAAMIPSTPKQAAAEAKKKKEPNKATRKNSKAVKTPQLSHAPVPSGNGGDASTPGGGQGGGASGNGGGGAPQTPSSNQPTPRVEHQQIPKALQPPSRSGTGGGANEGGVGDINGNVNHSMDAQQPSGMTSSASLANFEAFAPSLDGLGVSGAGVGGGSTSNADASNHRASTDAGLSNEDFSSLFASNEFFDFDAGGSSSGGGPNGGNGGTGNFDWDISSLSGMFGSEMTGGS